VVQNLLSFARQRKPQKQEVDLCKVLEESLTLREYDLRVNNVTLEREIPGRHFRPGVGVRPDLAPQECQPPTLLGREPGSRQ